jgi:hypothetical protein
MGSRESKVDSCVKSFTVQSSTRRFDMNATQTIAAAASASAGVPSALFEPIRLRDLAVANRVVVAPMCQ